jgi:hypothetical protein
MSAGRLNEETNRRLCRDIKGFGGNISLHMKPLALYLEEKGTGVDQLVAATGMDAKIVKAIVEGQYTPSPAQRQRLAAAIGVPVEDVAWGHSVPVQHLRGNGPQFGRST